MRPRPHGTKLPSLTCALSGLRTELPREEALSASGPGRCSAPGDVPRLGWSGTVVEVLRPADEQGRLGAADRAAALSLNLVDEVREVRLQRCGGFQEILELGALGAGHAADALPVADGGHDPTQARVH